MIIKIKRKQQHSKSQFLLFQNHLTSFITIYSEARGGRQGCKEEAEPEDNDDTTIFLDIEGVQNSSEDNDQPFDFGGNMFDLE